MQKGGHVPERITSLSQCKDLSIMSRNFANPSSSNAAFVCVPLLLLTWTLMINFMSTKIIEVSALVPVDQFSYRYSARSLPIFPLFVRNAEEEQPQGTSQRQTPIKKNSPRQKPEKSTIVSNDQRHEKRPVVSLNSELFRLRKGRNGIPLAEQRLQAAVTEMIKEQDKTIFNIDEEDASSGEEEKLLLFPDEVSFNSIISSHAKNSNKDWMAPQKAEQLLRQMQDLSSTFPQLKPSIFTFNAVMEAYAKSARSRNRRRAQQSQLTILRLFKELKNTSLTPNTYTYNLILTSNAQDSEEWQAVELWALDFLDGKTTTIKPDRQTYNQLLKGYADTGNADKAEHLLQRIIESTKPDSGMNDEALKPGTVWLNLFFKALAKSVDDKKVLAGAKADKWLKQMHILVESGLESILPDTSTYNHVLNIHALIGNTDRAEALVHELEEASQKHETNLGPDRITYTTLIKAYAAKQKHSESSEASLKIAAQATNVFEHMQSLEEEGLPNLSPNIVTCKFSI